MYVNNRKIQRVLNVSVWLIALTVIGKSSAYSTRIRLAHAIPRVIQECRTDDGLTGEVLWTGNDISKVRLLRVRRGRITDSVIYSPPPVPGWYGARPQFSPDGQRVVLPSFNNDAYNWGLKVVDLTTGRARQLTLATNYYHYAWSPNGRSLMTLSDQDHFVRQGPRYHRVQGENRLSVIDVRTGREQALIDHVDQQAGQAAGPAWALDGHSIVFQRAGSDDYWAVASGGGAPARLSRAEIGRRLGASYLCAEDIYRRQVASLSDGHHAAPPLPSPSGAVSLLVSDRPTDPDLPDWAKIEISAEQRTSTCLFVTRSGTLSRRSYTGDVTALRWSRDGRGVFCLWADMGDHLAFLDAQTGRMRRLTVGDAQMGRSPDCEILDCLGTLQPPAIGAVMPMRRSVGADGRRVLWVGRPRRSQRGRRCASRHGAVLATSWLDCQLPACRYLRRRKPLDMPIR